MDTSTKQKKRPHSSRNWPLVPSYGDLIMRFSRSTMYRKKALYRRRPSLAPKKAGEPAKPATKKHKSEKPRFVDKQVGGEKNGKNRKVVVKRSPRAFPTETRPRLYRTTAQKHFNEHKRHLRCSITPGTVLILLSGRHRGKHVVFLKQLKSGLLLVTGPMKLNGCPLRRAHQKFVIATRTKIDLKEVKVPDNIDDTYFKRKKPTSAEKKQASEDIFATKKEGYKVTEERKKDQKALDSQVFAAIKKNPEKGVLSKYLSSPFFLKKGQLPHKMLF